MDFKVRDMRSDSTNDKMYIGGWFEPGSDTALTSTSSIYKRAGVLQIGSVSGGVFLEASNSLE